MTEGPDPERLLAEALRAQAASTPVPPAPPLPVPGTAEGTPAESDEATESGPSTDSAESTDSRDAHLLDLFSGAGHGLLSGREPATDDVSYRRRTGDPTTGPLSTTRLSTRRPPLAWWWFVLLALALGLACGAIAGVLSLV